ncbi:hypothetical protein [Thermococcus barophilus]|uniref:Uncharacterized protein n=1 Tax=Thermococcus barophilus (strain DSM 11836 / MP) TaxID=391623 RepID=F0LN18_THEBM|nr:hypothetical protein [Thermococcus barophilus]ADT84147.1 hypothetical protein TERMP_01171 [Thermococcus barophilus MP]
MSKLAYIFAAMPGFGLMLSSWGKGIVYEKEMCIGFPCYAILIGYILVFVGAAGWILDIKFNTESDEYRKTVALSFLVFFVVGLLAVVSS